MVLVLVAVVVLVARPHYYPATLHNTCPSYDSTIQTVYPQHSHPIRPSSAFPNSMPSTECTNPPHHPPGPTRWESPTWPPTAPKKMITLLHRREDLVHHWDNRIRSHIMFQYTVFHSYHRSQLHALNRILRLPYRYFHSIPNRD